MEYQVLARKWRPARFADLIGQPEIVQTLENAITLKRLSHAYLFTGVRGVGKTTSARILAMALNCEKGPTITPCNQCSSCGEIVNGHHLDVREIDGASNTGVDDVRELKENIQYLPTRGRYKIYIIDEVHMLSKAAFNALLKTLEEPPAKVVFILATTEPHKLPDTILSRCQRFDFKRVAEVTIAKHLTEILQTEKVNLSESLVQSIAHLAQGSVRDALTLADRVIAYCGCESNQTKARELLGLIDRTLLYQLLEAIVAAETLTALQLIHKIYYSGYELSRLLESLFGEFRLALLLKAGISSKEMQLSPEEAAPLEKLSGKLKLIEIERYFDIVKQSLWELTRTDFALYLAESTLIKLCQVKSQLTSVHEVLEYLKREKQGRNSQAFASAPTAMPGAPRTLKDTPREAARETIDDPYIQQTVGLFGAKVEKIRIQDE